MEVTAFHNGRLYKADLAHPIDLSIAVEVGEDKVNAYYAHPVSMEPYRQGNWIGEVASGGSVNYRNIFFNPHGNGTHTECVGHITESIHSVNEHIRTFHIVARLVSVLPEKKENGDECIEKSQLKKLDLDRTEGLIIRTMPNSIAKRSKNYSGQNPPYFDADAVHYLVEMGCKHLVLDLPSLDRESDEGKLLGHKAFWNFPEEPRMDCSITELAFVPSHVPDGLYLLNLQIAPFENDAAPSRPVIYTLKAI